MQSQQSQQASRKRPKDVQERANALLDQMTLSEKIGQLNMRNASEPWAPDYLGEQIRQGGLGSAINIVDVDAINELQRIAIEESRLKIPLLIGRDVIHGFRTIFPIPLAQAATFNPSLVEKGARVAAREAASIGINWTFAPMIDIARDARWGRIAESFGEDVYLCNQFSVAMVEGFQGDELTHPDSIAACAKHFAGYGASESGRDYATTNIPEHELRNVYLPPFKAAVEAGAASMMSSFSDLNGVPATGSSFLLREILREEWGFEGVVVSDWDSVFQLEVHGFTENAKESAFEAITAGVEMEMASDCFERNLQDLIAEGRISVETIDQAVLNILSMKFRLGLFDEVSREASCTFVDDDAQKTARELATQSLVLLKNNDQLLPLSAERLTSIAVIGPLADAPYEQMGTWVFDGNADDSVTPLTAIRDAFGSNINVQHVRAMQTSRSRRTSAFDDAAKVAAESDVALVFLGEESILSGEAHSRADINLPGDQAELVANIKKTGTPVVAVVMAGRPLTLTNIIDHVDALIFAWHPGTMGGPAIADVLFGATSPSGKLPATFPRMVGQIPIYYNQKNGGKPPSPETIVHIDDIDTFAPQTSFGMTAFHLDAGYTPLFPFGYGLSYAEFDYSDIELSSKSIQISETLTISVKVKNVSTVAADEVVQLYVRDLVAQVTRPVKELKGFTRVHLLGGEEKVVSFDLRSDDLSFYGRNMLRVIEPGKFQLWVGGSSDATLTTEFTLVGA